MKRVRWVFIVTTLFVLTILYLSVFSPIITNIRATPAGTTYVYAFVFTPDYYQFISWIRDGAYGNLLLTTRYTQEHFPAVLIHPFFTIIGFVGSFVRLTPFHTLLFARIVILGLFCVVVMKLIQQSIPRISGQIIALLVLLTQSNFWDLTSDIGKKRLIEPIDGTTTLGAIGKFALLPHHMLALTALAGIILILSKNLKGAKALLVLAILTISTGFLNPTQLTLLLVFATIYVTVDLCKNRFSQPLKHYIPWFILLSAGIVTLGYHAIVFSQVLPWSHMYTLMKQYHPVVTFWQYISAFGPVVFIAWIPLLAKKTYQNKLLVLLSIWAFAPFALFFFLKLLPINFQRLLQSYQFVPLSILATIGIFDIATFIKKLLPISVTTTVISMVLISYGAVAFVHAYAIRNIPILLNLYNVFVPNSFIRILDWLEKNEPLEVVVLSGDYMSSMIPAFTRHRVVIGKSDAAPDYFEKQRLAFALFDDKLTQGEAYDFLHRYGVSYIIYGGDTRPFIQTKSYAFPFLKEVATDGSVSLVRVQK